MEDEIIFQDIPTTTESEKDFLVFKTRIYAAWQSYLEKIGKENLPLIVSSSVDLNSVKNLSKNSNKASVSKANSISLEERAEQYRSQKPNFSMEQLVVPESVKEELLIASKISVLEKLVFDEWGLRNIQPFPYSALNWPIQV
ncbi:MULTISPECIES: hypothetical protein [Microcystis]|jgi:hypothetical protein|uniref:Uncharacterized protein n=2 Tax=Microcystis TaxID=1125 RepID=B0JMT1_MICAN|nr:MULTISPECIES: hypothetical protein [Microcystis]BAG03366.1 hypothetical protein MAE_35440 [Microcystis aeruginosa NIES-843]BBH38555.1 hypothetical protein myaer102_10580 [Microcystis viridis NIES-102]